jgi:hypothetical protein
MEKMDTQQNGILHEQLSYKKAHQSLPRQKSNRGGKEENVVGSRLGQIQIEKYLQMQIKTTAVSTQ